MTIHPLHPWDLSAAEARDLQRELGMRVLTDRPLPPYRTVAGADVSYDRFSPVLHAAVVVLDAGTREVIERVGVMAKATFPYVPGLLSFREAPALLEAFRILKSNPDVVLCDGQGIAHPRRMGIASHLGLWLGVPTIGCAKSRLFGTYDEPGPRRGDRAPLAGRGEVVGSVVRTKDRVKPLFVSPGHLCDLESAVEVVMAMSGRYRLPEPNRMAHEYVNGLRREAKGLGS